MSVIALIALEYLTNSDTVPKKVMLYRIVDQISQHESLLPYMFYTLENVAPQFVLSVTA